MKKKDLDSVREVHSQILVFKGIEIHKHIVDQDVVVVSTDSFDATLG